MSSVIRVRTIDPRGQRFGAAFSAVTLLIGVALDVPLVAAFVGAALAVSAALGTEWFAFGRPWPSIRRALRLGPPRDPEPELGPRFAQALGALFIGVGLVLLLAGVRPWFWAPIGAVAALQTLLAVTGYCLGCRLYGLHWFLPEAFDRLVLRLPAEPRVGFRSPPAG
ncbi:MAG TPA: DUF4395 domain-containing protein [Candidatus Sulfomarinibacteraceae bacterium]|nr:DUF4395 domain-containing protein [Candidatus Sulfomarinibacteraceae bacterium]